jgi:hypothetical protein
VDWSSKSVMELEAFLRSRGVDLGKEGEGQPDEAMLVELATAIAADEQEQQQQQQQQHQGRQGGNLDGKPWWAVLACLTASGQDLKAATSA